VFLELLLYPLICTETLHSADYALMHILLFHPNPSLRQDSIAYHLVVQLRLAARLSIHLSTHHHKPLRRSASSSMHATMTRNGIPIARKIPHTNAATHSKCRHSGTHESNTGKHAFADMTMNHNSSQITDATTATKVAEVAARHLYSKRIALAPLRVVRCGEQQ
jgi:hypothetical protein